MVKNPSVKFPRAAGVVLAAAAVAGAAQGARADEGGVSFWIPGLFASLAATPQVPGFSLASIYYHTSVTGDGNLAFARQVTRGQFTAKLNADLSAHIDAMADLALAVPSYTFATPVFGGQANVSMLVPYGRSETKVDATLQASLGPFGFTRSGALDQGVTGLADLAPQVSLRWNEGVNNFMTYVRGVSWKFCPTKYGISKNQIFAMYL